MLIAVHNGGGTMAQFNHSEFGGAGQWMMGGMTMVSDLFNNALKNCVNNLCSDIAGKLSEHQLVMPSGSFQSQSQSGGSDNQRQTNGMMGSGNTLFVPDPNELWWPSALGTPSATGQQNSTKYAYFGDRRRLAVQTGGGCWVYDTGEHQIGGFSQQQGSGGSITLTSQFGIVELSKLPVIWRGQGEYNDNPPRNEPAYNSSSSNSQSSNSATANAASMSSAPVDMPPADMSNSAGQGQFAASNSTGQSSNHSGSSDVLDLLERLANLKERGLLDDQEFASKKSELLNRL